VRLWRCSGFPGIGGRSGGKPQEQCKWSKQDARKCRTLCLAACGCFWLPVMPAQASSTNSSTSTSRHQQGQQQAAAQAAAQPAKQRQSDSCTAARLRQSCWLRGQPHPAGITNPWPAASTTLKGCPCLQHVSARHWQQGQQQHRSRNPQAGQHPQQQRARGCCGAHPGCQQPQQQQPSGQPHSSRQQQQQQSQ
jgi:hypothetical protein